MGSTNNIIDICSDDELGELDVIEVKVEPGLIGASMQEKNYHKSGVACDGKLNASSRREDSGGKKSSNALSTSQSGILDQEQSPVDTSLSSASPICSAPLCRQFWKSGNYDDEFSSKSTFQNGKNYLNIHPRFLHSNATSHKWVFGAIAELLDNAVDEIQNGATFVIVDKTSNPRDGSPALLIQDDGGGMDPEAMRRCMSFGFSDKKSKSTIGQYGNGFKTSSMRLGADVIVFSRHMEKEKLTQSIGLLSYTFLTRTGHDKIVVPMVDYEFNTSTGTFDILQRYDKEHFISNLSVLLRWSPYSSEAELMKQFDDIGGHGTKIIVYSLWLNDEGDIDLDFDSDPEDIHIRGGAKSIETGRTAMAKSEQHLANRLLHSLRAYLSVLYLRIPEGFYIILRGKVVQHHNIANDLKYPEFIVYKPQSGGHVEGTIVTTIGFLKEAPHVNIHGFNVYHKNRLILPFWHVVNYTDSRGRGVVGILEANFIEPTHNKQDFEKTSVFQKLESRLKEMTWEYWDYHCGLIGYLPKKKPPAPTPKGSSDCVPRRSFQQPVVLNESYAAIINNFEGKLGLRKSYHKQEFKRKERDHLVEPETVKRRAGIGANMIDSTSNQQIQPATPAIKFEDQEATHLLRENKKLLEQCLESEKREKELDCKVTRLRSELAEVQRVYARLMREALLLDKIKEENNVDRVSATGNRETGT